MNYFQVTLLELCYDYTSKNSILNNVSSTKVVAIADLKDHLNKKHTEVYRTVVQGSCTLEVFLKETGRDIVRDGLARSWNKYNYELMTQAQYYADKRHDHKYFSALTNNGAQDGLLFVLFTKEDKLRYEAERQEMKKCKSMGRPKSDPLSDEIRQFFHRSEPTPQFFEDTKSLVNRLQNMLDTVWPLMDYRVAIFGSAANLLCLKGADVDLCIVVPEAKFESDLKRHKQKLSKQPKSVYNMFYLANRLRSIGMTNVEAIGNASVPICKFVDPQTGFSCDINTHNILGIENTNLVAQYTCLDARIRPFLTAIKHFVKQKDINSPLGGTLSSYAYVLMALHFLMAGLETPVIPSLQKLARCPSKHCKSKTGRQVLLYHEHQLIRCDARYHDCVRGKNSTVSEYHLDTQPGQNDSVCIWESKNKETISQLLNKFFVYYSNPKNRVISIITSDGKLYNQTAFRWDGQPIIVQDPFILGKNVARSCTTLGAAAIFGEFSRAAKLTSGPEYVPFSLVCDKQSNFPRPIDTECMQYRFHGSKQTAAAAGIRTTYVRHSKEDQFVGYLEDIRDNEQLESLLTPHLIDDSASKHHVAAAKATNPVAVAEKDVSAAATAAGLDIKQKGVAEKKDEKPIVQQKTVFNKTATVKIPAPAPAPATESSPSTNKQAKPLQQPPSQNNTQPAPILNLVKKLVSYQASCGSSAAPGMALSGAGVFENLTARPCTDMQKLLDDPCMSDVNMKDICYLIAQLNFLGESIAERVFNPATNGKGVNGAMKAEMQDLIEHENMAIIGQQLREMVYGEVIAEDDSEEDDLFGQYNGHYQNEGGEEEEEEETDDNDENYEDIDSDEQEQVENNMMFDLHSVWSQQTKAERKYKDNDTVDVYFQVQNVANYFDSYDIYLQYNWYGQVIEVKPTETTKISVTWQVHMRMLYETYKKSPLPDAVQLGDSKHEVYNVTASQLTPI